MQLESKMAEDLTEQIISKLQDDGLDLMNLHGQGYDNAATMAGVHCGVH